MGGVDANQVHRERGADALRMVIDGHLDLVEAASLADRPLPARIWHVENLIPGKTVTMLVGAGARGARTEVLAVAERLSAPMVVTLKGKEGSVLRRNARAAPWARVSRR